ncbi:hypothetical protein LEP1GSC203_2703 [Leptospira terpstrae serovar Hualin str. LT 11-33 = ATCC 700639]|uniref:Uncharacterized protein n=1 Tax=Leptospira terpstrae serovar Hualin str. LT 11-33 = ATCC 700639 TaxID=1257025 RepID=N1W395_9LEPT|nr:hypothetical protein LEP1GSC203_2703 [Leptospira terpstrae serovar Hualin str. LT 11-33 = ATCC 700639]
MPMVFHGEISFESVLVFNHRVLIFIKLNFYKTEFKKL